MWFQCCVHVFVFFFYSSSSKGHLQLNCYMCIFRLTPTTYPLEWNTNNKLFDILIILRITLCLHSKDVRVVDVRETLVEEETTGKRKRVRRMVFPVCGERCRNLFRHAVQHLPLFWNPSNCCHDCCSQFVSSNGIPLSWQDLFRITFCLWGRNWEYTLWTNSSLISIRIS